MTESHNSTSVEIPDDARSIHSGIEFGDAVANPDFFENIRLQQRLLRDDGRKEDVESGGMIARLRKHYSDKAQLKRIEDFEINELKVFIAQKLFKVDSILCDEQTSLSLVDWVLEEGAALDQKEMDRKYGRELSVWLRESLSPSLADCSSVLRKTAEQFSRMKKLDPLCNWFLQSPEMCSFVVSHIGRFAAEMAGKVKWSLLVEPGTFSCHLTELIGEFHRLELMSSTELSGDETMHSAFNANQITKARCKTVTCIDLTRVVLADERGAHETTNDLMDRMLRGMDSDRCTGHSTATDRQYGTTDFIHASYIRGGPLMNTFICTQAPMESTQIDFWRMVYQEKSHMIVMLCSPVELASVGQLDKEKNAGQCPYYWPRYEGDIQMFGDISVRNVRIDVVSDPLFTITHMEVQVGDEPPLELEHWQWDWQNMTDVHWPFRILRRARLLSTPTIIHCMDGCSRSGTLVAIETTLMHFLRGAPLNSDMVLQASMFCRLQRRHSIGSSLLYLFIYRCVLHWLSPYVSSTLQRISLGLWSRRWGFVHKYEEMAMQQTQLSPAY